MFRLLCAAVVVLAASAANADPPPGVKTIRVVLQPAMPPSPALRYALLPELRDQKPGNGIPAFHKAAMDLKQAISTLDDKKWYERRDHWLEVPLDQLPKEQVRVFLRTFDNVLRDVADAVRYEHADWELTDQLRKSGVSVLLPDIQQAREFASLLSLRFRLALAEGRRDDAVRDLQTMFALARQCAQSPTLISALVGLALSGIAEAQVELLIQQPGMPNLYWSLTDLPQPLIDLRIPFQGERLMAYGSFPGLPMSPHEEVKPLTPEQAEMILKMVSGLQRGEKLPFPDPAYKVYIALDLQKKHEKAKQALVQAGWPRASVEKMAHLQVGLLHGLIEYEQRMDETVKWNSFPYWQAAPALRELESRRARPERLPGPNEPAIPIADIFLAGSGRVMYARTRVDRKIAALRCLEAIRLHATRHDGKLPASLAEIKEVPIPVDPFTGKPFEYTAAADRATLFAEAVARPGRGQMANAQDALCYEIVMKR